MTLHNSSGEEDDIVTEAPRGKKGRVDQATGETLDQGIGKSRKPWIRRLRHRVVRIFESQEFQGHWRQVRHRGRHFWRFLRAQWEDFGLAFRDLKARIQEEIGSPDLSPGHPTLAKLRAPLRGQKAGVFPTRRPGLSDSAPGNWGRVLVVGGMDFFGMALVRHLNRKGIRDIVLVDDVDDGRWKNLPSLRFSEILYPDELDARHGRRVLSGADFSHVFHLGGGEQRSSPASARAILDFVADKKARLISISSADALGPDPKAEDILCGRPENFRPVTQAGVMACLFDRQAMTRLPDRRYLALKYHQLLGPDEPSSGALAGLIASAGKQALAGGVVRLPGSLDPDSDSGRRVYDFMSVRRAARMAVFLAESETTSGLYPLGSGVGHTAKDVVGAVFKALKCKPKVLWEGGADLPPISGPVLADLARLREAGWSQDIPSLEESVERLVLAGEGNREDYWEVDLDLEAQEGFSDVASHEKPPTQKVGQHKKPFATRRTGEAGLTRK